MINITFYSFSFMNLSIILTSNVSKYQIRFSEVWQYPCDPNILFCTKEPDEGLVTGDEMPPPGVQVLGLHLRHEQLHGQLLVLGLGEDMCLITGNLPSFRLHIQFAHYIIFERGQCCPVQVAPGK